MPGNEFYEAWHYLYEHPAFCHLLNGKPDVLPGFFDSLTIDVVLVDPVSKEADPTGTEVRIWLEAGPYAPWDYDTGDPYAEIASHDIRLDCGGATYEEAIISMSKLVRKYYG